MSTTLIRVECYSIQRICQRNVTEKIEDNFRVVRPPQSPRKRGEEDSLPVYGERLRVFLFVLSCLLRAFVVHSITVNARPCPSVPRPVIASGTPAEPVIGIKKARLPALLCQAETPDLLVGQASLPVDGRAFLGGAARSLRRAATWRSQAYDERAFSGGLGRRGARPAVRPRRSIVHLC